MNYEMKKELQENKELVKKCLKKMNTYDSLSVYKAYHELRQALSLANIEKIMVATWNRMTLAGEGRITDINNLYIQRMHDFYGKVEEEYFCKGHPTLWDTLIDLLRRESANEIDIAKWKFQEIPYMNQFHFVFEVESSEGHTFNISSKFIINMKNWCKRRGCKIKSFVTKSLDRNYVREISQEV